MIATSADAAGSASDAASDTGFSASATAPTVVASTVPLTNAAQLAQASSAAGAVTATTEKPADEGGMPQLRTEYWPGQILWLLIIFFVFFVVMAKVFAPRLRKVIDHRGETIAEDLANARANRDEAEAQARQLAAEAVARSNAEIAAVQAEEDKKLNARLGEADARIRAARDEAMSHV